MKRFGILLAAMAFVAGANASWYWPFDSDSDDDSNQPRLSELMEPASLLIDEAADLASDGKQSEAVEKYRLALAELDRIESENPERVKRPEFATVRNKRAYVNAAIDALLLSQVRSNARAVAVSDTTELEKKLAEERVNKKKEEANKKKEEAKKKKEAAEKKKKEAAEKEKKADEEKPAEASDKDEENSTENSKETAEEEKKPVEEPKKATEEQPKPVEEPPKAVEETKPAEEPKKAVEEEKKPIEEPKKVVPVVKPVVKKPLKRPLTKKEQALADIARGDYQAAAITINEMLVEKPNGAAALNIKAAMEAKQGLFKEAERTLDQAIMSNPRNYISYYNMARLLMEADPSNKGAARRYYETGRTLGGPENATLEGLVK